MVFHITNITKHEKQPHSNNLRKKQELRPMKRQYKAEKGLTIITTLRKLLENV